MMTKILKIHKEISDICLMRCSQSLPYKSIFINLRKKMSFSKTKVIYEY